MHIKKNKLFIIQPKSLEIPEVSGIFTDVEHIPGGHDKHRLTIYRTNKPIVILESTLGEIKHYLSDRFNFPIYSLTDNES